MARTLALPVLLAAAILGIRLAAPAELKSGDQGKSAQYALHAWQTGEVLVPLERGERLTTKPPLHTWTALAAFALTGGPGELAMRLPSLVSGLLLVLLTVVLARRIAPDPVPLVAGIVAATSQLFLRDAVLARPDMLFAALILGAVLAGHRALATGGRASGPLAFTLTALAVLAKGPVALVVVAGAIVPWALLRRERAPLRRLRPVAGTLAFLAVVAAWALPAALVRGRDLYEVMLVGELGRHATSAGEPVYTYLLVFPGRFLPWVLLLPAGLVLAGRERRGNREWPLGLLLCWFAVPFLVLSLVGSKRADYLLPLLPPAAVLVAVAAARLPRWRGGVAVAVGIGALLGAVAVALDLLPGGGDLAATRGPVLVAACLLAAALGWAAFRAGKAGRTAHWAGLLAAVFLVGEGVAYHALGEWFAAPDLGAAILRTARGEVPEGRELLVHRVGSWRNSILFRMGRAGKQDNSDRVAEEVAGRGDAFVVTTEEGAERLEEDGYRVVRMGAAEGRPGEPALLLVRVRLRE